MSVESIVVDLCRKAKQAARRLAVAEGRVKNQVLLDLADALLAQAAQLKEVNARDLQAGQAAGLSTAMLDRLTLDDKTIAGMAQGLREVAALPDPVGQVTGMWRRPNGLLVGRQRIPLGVIGFIYESRPNVTIDAAGLCIKSGNAVVLKGGKEAIHSNLALAGLITQALEKNGLPADAAPVIPSTEREATLALLQQEDTLDVVIPRGGEGLIRFVAQHSRVPVLKHYQGICHVYVDAQADLDMAENIVINAKCQRPGVCNALETLLVHVDAAAAFLPRLGRTLAERGVELRGCARTRALIPTAQAATPVDWDTEYLELILSIRVVDQMDDALDHIAAHGSKHTEAIVTRDYARAHRFINAVDSSLVLVNASTRFNDGGQLGLGAEIGISTSKLHAFGPMGLEELTTQKFIAYGDGQVRA